MHRVASSIFSRRTLLTFALTWALLLTGFYLWSIRGSLGFQSTDYFTVEVSSSSGRVDVVCSIQMPIRPGSRNGLNCEVKAPPANIATPPNYPIQVEVAISGNGFLVSPPDQHIVLKSEGSQLISFGLEPNSSGNQNLILGVTVADAGRATQWPLSVELKPLEIILITLVFAGFFTFIYTTIRDTALLRTQSLAQTIALIEKAEQRAESEPTKAKPAWDLARVKLEAYFDRNLFQVNQVFWLAVVMMIVGFGFVLAAVMMSLNHSEVTPAAKVAALSGIIIQFIGATFVVIYRSTMAQANEFMSVLERINTVGMAVQVLDSIPETNSALKDKTRAQIVELLLSSNVRANARKGIPKNGAGDTRDVAEF